MSSVVIGVDEAGRGPAIGPLVVSSICIPSGDLLHLESIGAKDSKTMSSKKRTEVESSILRESKKRDWRVCRIPISAKSIDEERAVKSLNSIEIERFVQAILEVSDYDSTGWVHVDLLGNDPSNFSKIMRKKISEHMRYSLDTSAHVHIMNEVDMTGVVNFVKKKGKSFYDDEGFNLTYTPFIIYCTVKVLMEMPEFNSSFDGQSQMQHENVNMGIAVSIDNGLMVPSILKCDEKNLLGICRELNEIVKKTRNGKIIPDDLQGSTFTLSNFGIFDAIIGTPIINQPNVGILGTGKIVKKLVVIEKNDKDIIAIRNMMMLSLGFDHRLIDGAGGAKFLLKIKNYLENINFENLL